MNQKYERIVRWGLDFFTTAAVCLWAGGFYILFVWLVIFMRDLIERSVPMPFVVNAISLFVTAVALFPFCGLLSDMYGRKRHQINH